MLGIDSIFHMVAINNNYIVYFFMEYFLMHCQSGVPIILEHTVCEIQLILIKFLCTLMYFCNTYVYCQANKVF